MYQPNGKIMTTKNGGEDSTHVKKGVPYIRKIADGRTIEKLDIQGKKVINSAVFPTKFLAEEAMARYQIKT